MKKIIIVTLVIFALIIAFITGYKSGINHAITKSTISVNDNSIYIELDGNTYEHNID